MALIECPNCGKKISDSAVICVHCNYDIKKARTREKLGKSFFNIPKESQKQYEHEFRSKNESCRKMYKFKKKFKVFFWAYLISIIYIALTFKIILCSLYYVFFYYLITNSIMMSSIDFFSKLNCIVIVATVITGILSVSVNIIYSRIHTKKLNGWLTTISRI